MFKKRNISKSETSSTKKRVLDVLALSDDSDSGNDSEVVIKIKKKKIVKNKTATKEPVDDPKPIDIPETEVEKSSLPKKSDATKQDSMIVDRQELERERLEEQQRADESDVEDGIYKGQRGYAKFFKPSSYKPVGSVLSKSAASIRSTTSVDFQPDVCKDYKQTGYCGYGDTCKFLHLRDDVKTGWKINREWESVGKSRKIDEEKLTQIPFKCPICKEDYKNPIMTPCKHYFCQSCYLTNYKKKHTCFICGKNTGGSMVIAKDLKKILNDNN